MMGKIGKLRSLSKDLRKNYDHESTKESFVAFSFCFLFFWDSAPWCHSMFSQTQAWNHGDIRQRFVSDLNKHIKVLDDQYDKLNDSWADGEVVDFKTDKFLGPMSLKSYSFFLHMLHTDNKTPSSKGTVVEHLYSWPWGVGLWGVFMGFPFKVVQWCRREDQESHLCVHSLVCHKRLRLNNSFFQYPKSIF